MNTHHGGRRSETYHEGTTGIIASILSLTGIKELADLSKNAPVGMVVGLKEESNMNIWKVDMEGPSGTPYVVRLPKRAQMRRSN